MSEDAKAPEPVKAEAFFEGAPIVEMSGKLPRITLEMEEGYARGTHLRLMIEVRVRSIHYDETKKGDLVREHLFVLEEAQLVSAFNPEQANDSIGGSASANAVPSSEETKDLGVRFGRSSEVWTKNGYQPTGTDDVGF